MPIRNRHRKGQYLILDDESGFVEYSGNVKQIWDGTLRHRKNFEERNPQEFVHALNDPHGIVDARPEPAFVVPVNSQPLNVGETNTPFVNGPASHLFGGNGVGSMIVENNSEPFIVAED